MELYNNYTVLISINSTAAFTVPGKKVIDLYDIDGKLKKRYTVTGNQNISARDVESLVPKVRKSQRTAKSQVKDIYYYLLRKCLWKLD